MPFLARAPSTRCAARKERRRDFLRRASGGYARGGKTLRQHGRTAGRRALIAPRSPPCQLRFDSASSLSVQAPASRPPSRQAPTPRHIARRSFFAALVGYYRSHRPPDYFSPSTMRTIRRAATRISGRRARGRIRAMAAPAKISLYSLISSAKKGRRHALRHRRSKMMPRCRATSTPRAICARQCRRYGGAQPRRFDIGFFLARSLRADTQGISRYWRWQMLSRMLHSKMCKVSY